jgi:hypothetical protein
MINRNLSIDYQEISQSVAFRKMVFTGLLITGIGFTLTPFLFKNSFDRESKTLMLTTGLVASLAASFMPKNELISKLKTVYEKNSIDQLKQQLTHEIAQQDTLLEIENKQALAQHIEHEIPDYQLPYWAKQLGLEPLISKFYIDSDSEESFEKLETSDNQIFTNNTQPLQPNIHTEKSSDLDWLKTIAREFTLPQGKRLHEHLNIAGGTQSGKSTLTSILITLIIQAYQSQGIETIINLIDPKYPMTTWCFNPTFTGYEQACEGLNQATKELMLRKKLAKEARKNGQTQPVFKPYIVLFDEWDTSYGKGKGYSSVITKDDAVTLLQQVSAIINEGAAYDVRIVLIGQSIQSQVNGLNTSIQKQLTRIVLGIEGLSWLESPYFPVKSQVARLTPIIEPLIESEKRCCVVVSNKGKANAYEIAHISLNQSQSDNVQDTPKKLVEPTETVNTSNPIDKLKNWLADCYEQNSEYPSHLEIAEAWEIITGQKLTDNALKLLIVKLGL